MKRVFLLSVLLVISIWGGVVSASDLAQDNRRLRWDRYDVTIDNVRTSINSFDITETYELTIEVGPFRFGTAEMPMDRLTAIENVAVYDGETALQGSSSGQPGTFSAYESGDVFYIKYYFMRQAESGEQRTVRLKYTVRGALRSYEDGDQLYWVAVPGDRPFPARDSRVVVTMPPDRPPEVTASYPDTWLETIEGTTVIWDAPGNLGTTGSVEVRVQYPHDPEMSAASWQAGFDRWRSYEESYKSIVSLLLAACSVFLIVGGVLFVYLYYVRHGRDPQAVVVPEYLSEPPSDELPGIVGLLVDERADMQDVMGTLVDLARRGYVVIEQADRGGVFGLFESTEFEFHRTDKSDSDIKSYERALLNGIFSGGKTDTSLSDLRNKFYRHIPTIKSLMYDELVSKEYFTRSPDTTRRIWGFGGIILMVVAGGLIWGVVGALTRISLLVFCPPIGIGVVGLAMLGAANFMPAKTLKGAQEAARWKAFRRYLENIKKYADLEQAAEQFERYIGYAVAFGVEKEWIRQCAPALTSMPTWYFPTYLGGPWHGGYYGRRHTSPGGGTGMGDFSLDGPGGLNSMSQSLTDGLNSMSSGLTKMLNDASRVMTSKPSSSGSRGGFSGGGGGGGGGSGGGSRGFG